MHEQQSQSTRRRLTATQERVLLHTYLTGAVPPRCRTDTLRVLLGAGLVVWDHPQGYVVTAQGTAYCATHIMDLRPFLARQERAPSWLA